MLILQDISYIHPNKNLLFSNINLSIQMHQKIALIGKNGVGKSTLLKIIASELRVSGGQISFESKPYYIPQIYGQYNHLSIEEVLGVKHKIHALNEILKGNISDENYSILDDDWLIEETCSNALSKWGLSRIDLKQKLSSLSGGEKTKVFLAGLNIHNPDFVLLDEPSNHLDYTSRKLLFEYINNSSSTILLVSHDRKLLNIIDNICELTESKINVYGGNYDFYLNQKHVESNALYNDILSKEKELRVAKNKKRESLERKQKLDNRGKAKHEKEGMAKIVINTLRNNAENSASKLKNTHNLKIENLSTELNKLKNNIPEIDKIKFKIADSTLYKGKVLFKAEDVNVKFDGNLLYKKSLNFEIISSDRIAINGANGSGKTSLIKLILNKIKPALGNIFRYDFNPLYIDQEYSLINNKLNIFQQAESYNTTNLLEHDIKIRLNRFLFTKDDWSKPCIALSGGEKMRLMLCCLSITNNLVDMIILDEPTNNLDLQNVEILTKAICDYKGTLIVVSHDETFLNQLNLLKTIQL